MSRRELACVLLGVLLCLVAFGCRTVVQRQADLDRRVSNIEQFLAAVTSQAAAQGAGMAASR
jgi:hypothetical protein